MKNPILVLAEKWRGWSKVQRGLVVVLALGLCFVVFVSRSPRITPPANTAGSASPPVDYQEKYPVAPEPESTAVIDPNERKQLQASTAAKKEKFEKDDDRIDGGSTTKGLLSDPLIAHTAELAVTTKEFSKSRTSLEEILERHRAYAAKLRMVGQKSGSVLNATLRVPSAELAATVSDLKSLGEVEQEAQLADEVTQQHADLEARLANARATLRRLQELLQKQTYPDGNVRELQRQIGNASGEVARLEAERQSSEHRVTFASVQFSMREVLAQPEESLGAQLHSAATAGFGEAAASISALLLFLIGRGPVVVLWCAILFLPARYLWKRWQPIAVRPTEAAQGD